MDKKSPAEFLTALEDPKLQEIGNQYITCTCDEAYKSRGLIAPDCAFHNADWESVAVHYASHLLQQREADKWIKVEEGCVLPDYDHPVLWLTEAGTMFVADLDKDGNPWLYAQEIEGFPLPKVTHYCELPTPPAK